MPTREPGLRAAPSGEVLAVEVHATTAPIATVVAVQCMVRAAGGWAALLHLMGLVLQAVLAAALVATSRATPAAPDGAVVQPEPQPVRLALLAVPAPTLAQPTFAVVAAAEAVQAEPRGERVARVDSRVAEAAVVVLAPLQVELVVLVVLAA